MMFYLRSREVRNFKIDIVVDRYMCVDQLEQILLYVQFDKKWKKHLIPGTLHDNAELDWN